MKTNSSPTEMYDLRLQIASLVDEYVSRAFCSDTFSPGVTPIPPSGKQIDSTEIKLMVEASLDGWLTAGRFNEEFEKRLANFIGIKHLITVNSV